MSPLTLESSPEVPGLHRRGGAEGGEFVGGYRAGAVVVFEAASDEEGGGRVGWAGVGEAEAGGADDVGVAGFVFEVEEEDAVGGLGGLAVGDEAADGDSGFVGHCGE